MHESLSPSVADSIRTETFLEEKAEHRPATTQWIEINEARIPLIKVNDNWIAPVDVLEKAAGIPCSGITHTFEAATVHVKSLNRMCRMANVDFKFLPGLKLAVMNVKVSFQFPFEVLFPNGIEPSAAVHRNDLFSSEAATSIGLKGTDETPSLSSNSNQKALPDDCRGASPTEMSAECVLTRVAISPQIEKASLKRSKQSQLFQYLVLQDVGTTRIPCLVSSRDGEVTEMRVSLHHFCSNVLKDTEYRKLLDLMLDKFSRGVRRASRSERLLLSLDQNTDDLVLLSEAKACFDELSCRYHYLDPVSDCESDDTTAYDITIGDLSEFGVSVKPNAYEKLSTSKGTKRPATAGVTDGKAKKTKGSRIRSAPKKRWRCEYQNETES